MNKTSFDSSDNDELLPEYEFDYSQAKPNRFAKKPEDGLQVVLDADVAQVFSTAEAVNHALRSLIAAMPKSQV
jgi:hypothetical protein